MNTAVGRTLWANNSWLTYSYTSNHYSKCTWENNSKSEFKSLFITFKIYQKTRVQLKISIIKHRNRSTTINRNQINTRKLKTAWSSPEARLDQYSLCARRPARPKTVKSLRAFARAPQSTPYDWPRWFSWLLQVNKKCNVSKFRNFRWPELGNEARKREQMK